MTVRRERGGTRTRGRPPSRDLRPPTLESGRRQAARRRGLFFCGTSLHCRPTYAPAPGIEAGPPYATAGVTASQIFVYFVSDSNSITMTNVMMGTRIGKRRAADRL